MSTKGEGKFKEPNGTAGYGSPCNGNGTLRDLNSSSHTGERPDRSQDASGGIETP